MTVHATTTDPTSPGDSSQPIAAAAASQWSRTEAAIRAGQVTSVRLLVIDEAGFGERIAEELRDFAAPHLPTWEVQRVRSLSEASDRHAERPAAAVLMVVDAAGWPSVRQWASKHPSKPLVVVEDGWDEPTRNESPRYGVNACLPREDLTPLHLTRQLWQATVWEQSHRETDRFSAKRSAGWVDGPQQPGPDGSGDSSGNGIHERGDADMAEGTAELRRLVERALRQRFFSSDAGLTDDIDRLACWIGDRDGTPRDVYRMYRRSLKALSEKSKKRHRVIRTEAEYVLLGVMARLAGYYRRRCVRADGLTFEKTASQAEDH